MRRAISGIAAGSVIALVTLGGCNAILDNDRGVLATTDESSTEPPPKLQPEEAGRPPNDDPDATSADAAGDGDAGSACPVGQHSCFGACVADGDPLYGCGDPTCRPCAIAHGTAACQGAICTIATCNPAHADCNANPADGCETDLSRATSCGECATACPPTAPACAPVGATFACTTLCAPPALLLCGAECVDPLTSVNHCSGCNVKCRDVAHATTTCTSAVCGFVCEPQYHACGESCVVDTDPTACGPACTPCPVVPNAVAMCQGGGCGFQCAIGFADCNHVPADGCESNLATDPANCGACGAPPCAAPNTCVNGICTPPPP